MVEPVPMSLYAPARLHLVTDESALMEKLLVVIIVLGCELETKRTFGGNFFAEKISGRLHV
jgi:hypothetical protein